MYNFTQQVRIRIFQPLTPYKLRTFKYISILPIIKVVDLFCCSVAHSCAVKGVIQCTKCRLLYTHTTPSLIEVCLIFYRLNHQDFSLEILLDLDLLCSVTFSINSLLYQYHDINSNFFLVNKSSLPSEEIIICTLLFPHHNTYITYKHFS